MRISSSTGARVCEAQAAQCPSSSSFVTCSGHGTCSTSSSSAGDDATCSCSAGYSGSDCSRKDCPTGTTPGGACSGRGACNTATGTCTCSAGFTSSDCRTAVSTPKTCPGDCSGHGTCDEGSGLCSCSTGFTGSACSTASTSGGNTLTPNVARSFTVGNREYAYFTLPSIQPADTVVLTVTDTGGDPDVYVSSTTSRPSRSDYELKSTGMSTEVITIGAASGGAARNFGIAVYGWGESTGAVTAVVVRGSCSAATTCRGQGSCSAGGGCSCNAGWTGADCGTPDCPGTPACNNRGTCSASGCVCAAGFSGSACEVDQTAQAPVAPPSTGSDTHDTLSVGTLTVRSWKHWKITITGASSSTQQTMKLTMTRPDTASDTMMMVRKGSRPEVSSSNRFSFSWFDRDAWMADSLTQTVELTWPDLSDGEYFIGVFNYDRYVQGTSRGATVQVDIAKPSAPQAAAMTSSCSCSGHGQCVFGTDNLGTTCRCEAEWAVKADCSVGATSLPLGTSWTSAQASVDDEVLHYFDVADARELVVDFETTGGASNPVSFSSRWPQLFVQKVGFDAEGSLPSATTGALTDHAAWAGRTAAHSIRLAGGELRNGRYLVRVVDASNTNYRVRARVRKLVDGRSHPRKWRR